MNTTLLTKTIRDLRAAWAQSLALTFIFTLGIISYISLISSFRDLSTSYDYTYDTLAFADVTFAVNQAPATAVDTIAAIDGVTAATGRLIRDTGYQLPDEPIRSRLIGLPTTAQPAVNKIAIQDGRYFQTDDDRVAIVDSHFATAHNIHVGDTVTPIINGQVVELAVIGLATSPEYLIVSPGPQDIFPSARTFAVLFLPLPTVQELTNLPATINNIAILTDPAAHQPSIINRAQAKLTPFTLESTTLQANQTSNNLLRQDLEGYEEMANSMPGLILVVAAISVYIMLGRMVRAQQPQIGLMKSLGYGQTAVLLHYLAFALAIGLLGLIAGVIFGIPLASSIVNAYATELGIPFVNTNFYPELILQSIALTLIIAALAGLGPAYRSSRLEPALAMRLDPSVALVQGRLSLIERLLPLPLELRLPLRNIFRMRRRSLTTALGIIFSFVLVLMVWGMYDSVDYLFTHNFEEIERWDATAVFSTPQMTSSLDDIRAWDDVIAAEPLIQAPATFTLNGTKEDLLLTALPPQQQMHILQLPAETSPTTALGQNQIILTAAFADQHNLSPGDIIPLDTPLGQADFTFSTTTDELITSMAYISLDDAQALAPIPLEFYTSLYLQIEDGSHSRIKQQLYRQPGVASVTIKDEMLGDMLEMMNLFYAFMGIMLFFSLGMAFALLFNTTTVNVLERQRELATMRSIGTDNRQIAWQITLENSLLWLLSLPFGIWAGTWVAAQMVDIASSELFKFDIIVAPTSYLYTSIGILLTIIIAAYPAIRRTNRLNLASATKVLT
ncbi:MAG TPA: FtsX-like permease family protein [Anaerolineae bacterium]|nr:FtsX-like permease family protein [Anaerolineae bacterium]